MADGNAEEIGSVKVTIVGDFAQLEAQFQAAIADARANGATWAQAVSQALDTLATHGEFASTQMGKLATEFRNAGTAATAAAAGVKTFNAELDATGENVDYAGGKIGGMVEKTSGSFRAMIGELRLFRSSVLILMAPEMLAGMIGGIVKYFEAQREAAHNSIVSWREFNETLTETDLQLQVSNDKLANQIAKLRDVPQNNLKTALDEDTLAAERLANALERDLDEIDKLLQKSEVNLFARALGTPGLEGLRDALHNIQDAEGGSRNLAAQMQMVTHEIDAAKLAFNQLSAAAPNIRGGLKTEIQAVSDLLAHLEEQLRRIEDEAKNTALNKDLSGLQDKTYFPTQHDPFGAIKTSGMNRDQVDAAVLNKVILDQIADVKQGIDALAQYQEMLNAGNQVFRKSGESIEEWTQRSLEAEAAVKAGPPVLAGFGEGVKAVDNAIKDGAANFRDMKDLLETLPNPLKSAAMEWHAFDQALKDLHLRDSDEELVKLRADLDLIAQHSGTASQDFRIGFLEVAKVAADAAMKVGDFKQQIAADTFHEIPQMFNSIESAMANDLIHWKNWSQSIVNIFQQLGQQVLQTLLSALFKPLQQALQQAIGMLLTGLSGGVSDIAGGVIPGASAFPGFSFASGIDEIPHTMRATLHAGERVMTKESNNVFTKLMNFSMPSVPSMSAPGVPGGGISNSSTHGDTYDFSGSTFHGISKSDIVDSIMNIATKKMRRVNTKI